MTRLLVSTVRRRCPPDEPSGHIYTVDLASKQVLRRSQILEPAYRQFDDNPRGGMRGAKGIAIRDNQIALANFSMICLYDAQWNLVEVISHPSCAGIHDILYQHESLWVTVARTDLLMRFDLSGQLIEHYDLREPTPVLDALDWDPPVLLNSEQILSGVTDFRDPRTHEWETYDWAHINGISTNSDGDLFISLGFVFDGKYANLLRLKNRLKKLGIWPVMMGMNRRVRSLIGNPENNIDNSLVVRPARAQSAIVRFSPTKQHQVRLHIPSVATPSHSLHLLPDDNGVYLNTTEGAVIHFDTRSGQVISSKKVTDGFLRGICELSAHIVVAGSMGWLLTYDLETQELLGSFQLTLDPTESIYDIKVLPSQYELPPLSFEKHFEHSTGFKDAAEQIKYHRNP